MAIDFNQPRPRGSFLCSICEQDIGHRDLEEYPYMLHDALWKQVCEDVEPVLLEDCMLCIGCLETRLGRELTWEDFKDAPINDTKFNFFERSKRLRSRQTKPFVCWELPIKETNERIIGMLERIRITE